MKVLNVALAFWAALSAQFIYAAPVQLAEFKCPEPLTMGSIVRSFDGFEYIAQHKFPTQNSPLVSPEDLNLKKQFENRGVLTCFYTTNSGNKLEYIYPKDSSSKFAFENNTSTIVSYKFSHKPCPTQKPCSNEAGLIELATESIKCNGNNVEKCKFYIVKK